MDEWYKHVKCVSCLLIDLHLSVCLVPLLCSAVLSLFETFCACFWNTNRHIWLIFPLWRKFIIYFIVQSKGFSWMWISRLVACFGERNLIYDYWYLTVQYNFCYHVNCWRIESSSICSEKSVHYLTPLCHYVYMIQFICSSFKTLHMNEIYFQW